MKILTVGKSKKNIWILVEEEYKKRLSVFTDLDIEILPASKQSFTDKAIFDEADRLMNHIKDDDFIVALDLSGQSINSEKQAALIDKWQSNSKKITFVIGGTYGLSQIILDRADFIWKLSDLTFTHDMVRSILLEQLYRAFMINSNKSYHH